MPPMEGNAKVDFDLGKEDYQHYSTAITVMKPIIVISACPTQCSECTYDSTSKTTKCTSGKCEAKYTTDADGKCAGSNAGLWYYLNGEWIIIHIRYYC